MDPTTITTFRQKAISAGYTPKQADDFVRQKMEGFASTKLAAGGFVPFQDFAKTSPIEAYGLVSSGFQPPPENLPESEQAEKRGRDALKISALQALQGLAEAKKMGKNVTGGETAIFRKFRESLGLVDPTSVAVRALVGKVGAAYAFATGGKQFTETELELISPLLPRPNEDERVIATKLKSLISTIDALEQTKTANGQTRSATSQSALGQIDPDLVSQDQQAPGFVQSVINAILDPLVGTAKTIGGAGVELFRRPGDLSENPFLSQEDLTKYRTDPVGQVLNQAGRSAALPLYALPFSGLAGKSAFFAPTVAGKAVLPAATSLKGATTSGAIQGGLFGAAQPEEGTATAKRFTNIITSATTGAAIGAATYGVSQLAQKIRTGGAGLPKTVKSAGLAREQALAQHQNTAVDGQRIYDEIARQGQKLSGKARLGFMKNIDADEAFFIGAKGQTAPQLTVSQIVDRQIGANMVYQQSPKAVTRIYAKAVGDAIRKELGRTAPEVAAANQAFGKAMGLQTGVQKTVKRAAAGAAFLGPAALLARLLGIGSSQTVTNVTGF